MSRRRFTLVLGLVAALACRPSSNVPTVAIYNLLSYPILDESIVGIKEGLATAGYGPDRVRLVEVNAGGEMDKVGAFAREILTTKPAIIIPVSTPVAQAVFKEASTGQQIVYSTVTNPSDIGMDGRPGNMTGVSDAVNYAGNIALIRELFPAARRIGMVYNPGERNSQFGVDEVRKIALAEGLELVVTTVSRSDEVATATAALVRKVDALYLGSDNTVAGALAAVLQEASRARVPVIASEDGSVDAGALAAVSVNYRALGRRVGAIVASLLESGRNAGTVPPEFFRGDALVLNAKAAAATGVIFPDSVLKRAARVVK